MNLNFQGLNSFITKKQVVERQSSLTQTTQETTTKGGVKTFDLKEIATNYAKTCLENANKIKELTEKLNNMKLSERPTEDEIDNYISQINSMKSQASELYDLVGSFNYNPKCKEHDELVYAYENFEKIAQNQLARAEVAKQQVKGQMSSAALLDYLETVTDVTSTTPQSTTEGGGIVKTFDFNVMAANYAKTAQESGDKIKEMTKELEKLELSENPSAEEINCYVKTINSMRLQANELYDILSNYSVRTKCREYDEFYHAYINFEQLAQKKLAESDE